MIIKAVAGGGGRGMNVVYSAEELPKLYQPTRATAQAVFKDTAVYIERYLEAPSTPRCSSSATSTATASTSASATARCSAATRS